MDKIVHRFTVPENQRMETVGQTFGLLWPLRIEPLIFHLAECLSPEYPGGLWTFYTLSPIEGGNGFYMAPDSNCALKVLCADNQWQGTLSADAFGITCCLRAYSHLSFSNSEALGRLMAQHYHRLRQFMLGHPEAQAILGATD